MSLILRKNDGTTGLEAPYVGQFCTSQRGQVLWCAERGGKLTIRSSHSLQLLMVVGSEFLSVENIFSTEDHVWVLLSRGSLLLYDAWRFTLIKKIDSSVDCKLITSVSNIHVATITHKGHISIWNSNLDIISQKQIPNGTPMCVSSGGRFVFIGNQVGTVSIVETPKLGLPERVTLPTYLRGTWQAHDRCVECIICCEGYVITTSASDVFLWDPFPADGSGRIAHKTHTISCHTSTVISLSIFGTQKGTVSSVDESGCVAVWSIYSPSRPAVTVLSNFIKSFSCVPTWTGTYVGSLRHSQFNRYIACDYPDLWSLPHKLIKAQSEMTSAEIHSRHTVAAAFPKLQHWMAESLLLVTERHEKYKLREWYRRIKAYRSHRLAMRLVEASVNDLFFAAHTRRVCWNRMKEFVLACRSRKATLNVVRNIFSGQRNEILHRYLKTWKLFREKRVPSQPMKVLLGFMPKQIERAIIVRYYERMVQLSERARARIPKGRAAVTLLKCNVYAAIRNCYHKWKGFSSKRSNQRKTVGHLLIGVVGSVHSIRSVYFWMWRRWLTKKQKRREIRDIATSMGDVGLLFAYFRKLKMYVAWKTMQDIHQQKKAAARYFNELVREEEELASTISFTASWPACAITTALGMNIEKWMKEGMVFYCGESDEYTGMRLVSEKLRETWHMKKGDILDELAENLAAPPGVNKEACIWQLCKDLSDKYAPDFRGQNVGPVELLAMRLYTLEGPDVDRHLGFGDVPPPINSVPPGGHLAEMLMLQWDSYKKVHASISKPTVTATKTGHSISTDTGDRNPSIYHEMNKALRTSQELTKWAKLSSLLMALSTPIEMLNNEENEPSSPLRDPYTFLYRGIHNLPQSVIDAHMKLQRGWSYAWLAPSSTSEDKQASADFLKKTDPRFSILFVVKGCNEGLPLHKVSQFPDEAEVLLPPFSTFVVSEEPIVTPEYIEIRLLFKGTLVKEGGAMTEFIHDIREDARMAAQKRYCLDTTKQLQAVEGAARTHLSMEETLISSRLFQNAKLNRIHALRFMLLKKRDDARRKTKILRMRHEAESSLAERWRIVHKVKPGSLDEVIENLKLSHVIDFSTDISLITKTTAILEAKDAVQVCKEAYYEIKGVVSRTANTRYRAAWPGFVAKRMSPVDKKRALQSTKILVIAYDHITMLIDKEGLQSIMDLPLSNLVKLYKRMVDPKLCTPAPSPSLSPMGSPQAEGDAEPNSPLNLSFTAGNQESIFDFAKLQEDDFLSPTLPTGSRSPMSQQLGNSNNSFGSVPHASPLNPAIILTSPQHNMETREQRRNSLIESLDAHSAGDPSESLSPILSPQSLRYDVTLGSV